MYVTPKSTKGGTKRDFALFASKIQLLFKKILLQSFFGVKTSSSKVVATSFPYLSTVHRWVAGDVPICLKFAIKVTHPFRKR